MAARACCDVTGCCFHAVPLSRRFSHIDVRSGNRGPTWLRSSLKKKSSEPRLQCCCCRHEKRQQHQDGLWTQDIFCLLQTMCFSWLHQAVTSRPRASAKKGWSDAVDLRSHPHLRPRALEASSDRCLDSVIHKGLSRAATRPGSLLIAS